MSEYVISQIVNYERDLFQIKENKSNKLWSQSGKISEHRSISDLNIGILGIGVIGNQSNYISNQFFFGN